MVFPMKKCQILSGDTIIADNIAIAESFFKRLTGLLRHKKLEAGEGMLICPCSQVHTYGMKFSIDVIFLAKDNHIIQIEQAMAPGKMSKLITNSRHVLELQAGAAAQNGLQCGDQLTILSL